MWRLCGHTVSLPSMDSEFSALTATSLLVLSELSRKFRRSWFVPVVTRLLVLSSLSASFCHTSELDAASFLYESVATGFTVFSWRIKAFWPGGLSIPRRLDAFGLSTVEELASVFEIRFNVGLDCTTSLSSPCPCCILFAIVFGQLGKLSWNSWCYTNGEDCSTHHVWNCPVFGVNIFDLNLRIQIDYVKLPVMCNSVGSGYMSHRWTSAFNDHFNHCFIVFKDAEHCTKLRRLHDWRIIIDIA